MTTAQEMKRANVVQIIIVRMELKLFRIVDVCLRDYSLNYTDTRVGRDLDNTRGKLHESNVHLSDILRGQIDKIVLHETSGMASVI